MRSRERPQAKSRTHLRRKLLRALAFPLILIATGVARAFAPVIQEPPPKNRIVQVERR